MNVSGWVVFGVTGPFKRVLLVLVDLSDLVSLCCRGGVWIRSWVAVVCV